MDGNVHVHTKARTSVGANERRDEMTRHEDRETWKKRGKERCVKGTKMKREPNGGTGADDTKPH